MSSDCSPWPCWHRTKRSMWGAYWWNCVGPSTRGLSLRDRCCLLNRSVRPVLCFRNTRWPFTLSLAEEQNRLQRRMLSQFLQVERWPLEDCDKYHRRRMRLVSSVARSQGLWGDEHAKRVIAWAEHLTRAMNHSSLASFLYRWHGEEWLHNRRLDPLVGCSNRLGTRAYNGPVYRRWDETVSDAALHLQ